jgi:hypothetical protein
MTTPENERSTQNKTPATIDGSTLSVLPTPRSIPLKTLDDVRREMAKVYRDMRKAKIEMGDGTKLVYVLSQLGKVIELSEVSARLEAVERTLKVRRLK